MRGPLTRALCGIVANETKSDLVDADLGPPEQVEHLFQRLMRAAERLLPGENVVRAYYDLCTALASQAACDKQFHESLWTAVLAEMRAEGCTTGFASQQQV